MTVPRVVEIAEGIFSIEAFCSQDYDVRALLVLSGQASVLIDTLARPRDLEPLRTLLAPSGSPSLIVNTHADWDHWFGNSAFGETPVVGLEATRQRQLRDGRRTLANLRRRDPNFFAGVELRPATITFRSHLTLQVGAFSIELHHLPGHTSDSLLAFVPEAKLLFAADCAEDPIPVVGQSDVAGWAAELDRWADLADVVVPSHGEIGGPELLRRNARYLGELRAGGPADFEELEGLAPFYRRTHRENLRRVRSDR